MALQGKCRQHQYKLYQAANLMEINAVITGAMEMTTSILLSPE
jgi:hypothetical protein